MTDASNAPATHSADLCVYGGTSAGCAAAIAAARLGRRVLLVEAGQHLGGMCAEGLGGTDIDNHAKFQNSPSVGGIKLELHRRLARHYGIADAFDDMVAHREKEPRLWKFEPSVAERVFDDWMAEVGVTVLRGHRLTEDAGVTKAGTDITALHFDNGATVTARVFIDGTYEGDLLAAAGVDFAVGREGNALYDETKNGIRTDTTHSQIDRPVDPYVREGDPTSGVIHAVSDEPLGEHGAPSDAIQAFSFRCVFTNDPANFLPIEKPDHYDPADYELQRRYLRAGGVIMPGSGALPNGKTEPGCWHPLSGFLAGWNHDWNTATYARRDAMLTRSLDHVKGLHWFFRNDPAVPTEMRDAWRVWGLCRDEFTDNAGWPRVFYPRNGRRMISDLVMTEAHGRARDALPVEDSVGLNHWPHDLHSARRIIKDGVVWNEGAVFNGIEIDWRPFGIAYRSLVPKRDQCTNLLVAACPSMSYVAYGAFRTEFGFMIAGQSTGAAAALALDANISVQDVDYGQLREVLITAGQIVEPAER